MRTTRPQDVQDWLARLPDERQEQAERLADLVHAAHDGVDEALKWRRLTFTVDGNWHHWLCAVAASKKAVNLTFHKGALLDDPAGLLEGDGRYTRQVPYERAAEDPEAVTALVRSAVEHQEDMLEE
jgi:hypothetical protein